MHYWIKRIVNQELLDEHLDRPCLIPAVEKTHDYLSRREDFARLSGTVSQPRNLEQHKLFWKVLELVSENLPNDYVGGCSKEQLKDTLCVAIGHCTSVYVLDKGWAFYPKSIAFDQCTQTEFQNVFDRVMEKIAERFGMDVDVLLEEARQRNFD